MLKAISIICIVLSVQFFTTSCKSNNPKGNSSANRSVVNNANAGGGDTIKANLTAKDKNSQALNDGTLMAISNKIIDNLGNAKQYSTFLTLLEKSSLYRTLMQKGPYTVFAPSNEAFGKLSKATMDRLMSDAGRAEREKLLKYHVIGGILRTSDLTNGESISTVEGDPLVVVKENGKTKLKDAEGHTSEITQADVFNKNGIMHLVDAVLIPKKGK